MNEKLSFYKWVTNPKSIWMSVILFLCNVTDSLHFKVMFNRGLIMPLGNKENTSFLDPGASKEQVFQVTIDLAFNWSIYYWSLTHAKIPDGRNGGNIWKQRHLVMYRTNVCGPEGGLTMIRTWRSAFKLDNDKVKVNCCNLGVLRLTSTHTKHQRTIPWCWPHLKLSIQISITK